MRPFQKKIAFWDMANYLVQTTDLMEHEKSEIMWRTATSKEPLQPETAWKRARNIEKELASLVEQIQPFLQGHSHEEAVHALIQNQWVSTEKLGLLGRIRASVWLTPLDPTLLLQEEAHSDHKGKPFPESWQFSHNNCLMCYRMFYRGSTLNPDLPPAVPPKPVLVPQERPPRDAQTIVLAPASALAETAMQHTARETAHAAAVVAARQEHDLNDADLEAIGIAAGGAPPPPRDMDDRRTVLQEVRAHLDLLKEFEGIIPAEELNSRKRQLYLALPPAPPPHVASNGGGSSPVSSPKRARAGDKASV
jgi:hypothetical protein